MYPLLPVVAISVGASVGALARWGLALWLNPLASMPLEALDVHINLHPQEFARIRDLVPERAASWRLVANDTLALGECRIVTPQAEVDVGCQQRLDACVATLSEHLHLIEE